MIAATIAFTPVATTAGVFGADKVEAAISPSNFNSTSTLAAYSDQIYAKLSADDKIIVDNSVDVLKEITESDWTAILSDITHSGESNAFIADFIFTTLAAGSEGFSELEIEGIIQNTYTGFDYTDREAAETDYLTFLELVEQKMASKYATGQTAEVIIMNLMQSLKEAVADPTAPTKIVDHLTETIDLSDNQDIVNTVTKLRDEVIEKGSDDSVDGNYFRSAVTAAAKAWYDVNYPVVVTPPSGGGGTVDNGGVEGPGTGDEDGPVVVDPVVVEGTTEIVVTIPETLQTQIVDAAQPETTEVIIEVPVSEDGKPVVLDIPVSLAAALKTAAPNADIVIQSGDVSYVIPVSKINLTALGASLGGSLDGVSLRINLEKLPTQRVNNLQGLIRSQVGAPTSAASSETSAAAVSNVNIVAPAIEVTVELVKNDTVVQELKSFGSVYVNQEFVLDTQVDPNRTTGVSVEADGSFKALPTTFKSEDGKQIAVVKTLANAGDVYTVLESSVTFPDVDGGKNWAEKYIESLSSKFIISGTTAGTYKPDQDMTRSQFAFLLSRALGLPGTTAYDGRFSDVEGDEWFNANGEFMAAVNYGVIAGKTDGTFGADEKVTRAEAAAMIGRAMELGFIEFDKSQLDTSKTLAGFKDAKEIGASTRAEVLKVVQAGIMSGASNGEFNPNDYTKRDQMARILAEFLMKADLMQDIK